VDMACPARLTSFQPSAHQFQRFATTGESKLLGGGRKLVRPAKVTGSERPPRCLAELPSLDGEQHDRPEVGSAPRAQTAAPKSRPANRT
jgi:hypothetical protein